MVILYFGTMKRGVINEEKNFIWTDRDTGTGRLRQNIGKGMISFFNPLRTDFFSIEKWFFHQSVVFDSK